MIKKGFVDITSATSRRQVHYRIAGQGPVLIALHASPMSSAMMEPLMLALAEQATVIAPDTPGYGLSDPLFNPEETLVAYVMALDELVQALGVKQFVLYGTATGAQIAIEYAKQFSSKVHTLILDNAASFTDDQREQFLEGYFPDISARMDGSHLATIWTMAADQTMFFPWFKHEENYRLSHINVPAQVTHQIFLAYLLAGPDYARAYRAAFYNERVEQLQALTVPTYLMRWQGSILKPYMKAFDTVRWDDHFQMVHCGSSLEERWQCLKSICAQLELNQENWHPPGSGRHVRVNQAKQAYANLKGGQLHYLQYGSLDAQIRVDLVIHDLGGAARQAARLVNPNDDQSGSPTLYLDLPGHGASDPILDAYTIAAYVEVLREFIELSLPAVPIRVRGIGFGALLADELAVSRNNIDCVNHAAASSGLLNQIGLDELEPDSAGSHCWRAWHQVRTAAIQSTTVTAEAQSLTFDCYDLLVSSAVVRKTIAAMGNTLDE